jgi:deoxycytidylate deaminase
VADVGNGDDQAEAALAVLALALAIDGVVEILRRLAVDGHQRQVTDVLAYAAFPFPVALAHRVGQLLRFRQRLLRELEGQLVFPQGNLDLHAGIGVVAEHLDHLADRLRMLRGLLDDLGHHHLPRHRLGLGTGGQQDVLADAPVLGHHEQHAMLVVHAADDAMVGALQHLDDLALRAAAAVHADDARHDAVAVQGLVHFLRAEKQVGALLVAHEEAVAVGVALDAPADEVGLVGNEPVAAAVLHDLAVALHGAQAALEGIELMLTNIEQSCQRLEGQRHAALGQRGQHVLAARQGIFVFPGLAFIVRIALAHLARLV